MNSQTPDGGEIVQVEIELPHKPNLDDERAILDSMEQCAGVQSVMLQGGKAIVNYDPVLITHGEIEERLQKITGAPVNCHMQRASPFADFEIGPTDATGIPADDSHPASAPGELP